MPTLPDLNEVAELVMMTAKQELIPRFGKVQTNYKEDGSLVSHADLAVQQMLADQLKQRWPDYPLLSEEQPEATRELALQSIAEGVWCLDPLDGTSNFVAGIPYYAVSLALLVNEQVVMSVVYDPSRDECFSTLKGQGAFLNGQPLQPAHRTQTLNDAIALVDFKRLPATLCQNLAATPPYKSQRSFGAVALDWCWLATNRVQVYLHGKQKLWDYAAGQQIFAACNGHACTLDNEPVFSPTLAPRSAIAALDADTFAAWVAWVEKHS